MTLTEFLLARIAEDEADVPTLGYTMHLTPERRLAECEAKRRIVELHRQMYPRNSRYLPNCEGCWEEGGMDGAPTYPCRTIRWLGAVYADHPDYREEWRP